MSPDGALYYNAPHGCGLEIMMKWLGLPLATFGLAAALASQETPFLESELVFPLEHWHNHASMIVEAPNGDLIVDWFHGSGERTADDVVVRGARLRKGAKRGVYSDGFSFSLMAITDDWGATWHTSTPLVGGGNIQPSIARKKDGTLVACMRDNGPAPKRLHISRSRDRGETWSAVEDSALPNPGAGAEVRVLANGHWILVYNDLEQGRYRLAVSLSEDEGATWPWTRYLERDPETADPPQRGEYHYPSIIQARDGTLHASYSYFIPPATAKKDDQGRVIRKSIKHAHFNEAWITSAGR